MREREREKEREEGKERVWNGERERERGRFFSEKSEQGPQLRKISSDTEKTSHLHKH